jgi:hypothetical protein
MHMLNTLTAPYLPMSDERARLRRRKNRFKPYYLCA